MVYDIKWQKILVFHIFWLYVFVHHLSLLVVSLFYFKSIYIHVFHSFHSHIGKCFLYVKKNKSDGVAWDDYGLIVTLSRITQVYPGPTLAASQLWEKMVEMEENR